MIGACVCRVQERSTNTPCADTAHGEEGSECEGMNGSTRWSNGKKERVWCALPVRHGVKTEEEFASGAASWAGTEL